MENRPHSNKTAKTRPTVVPEAPPRLPVFPQSLPAMDDQRSAIDAGPDMLTYQALARATGIRVSTLYGMTSRGEVPHFRLGPRIVRFAAKEIAEWMAARHQPARTSDAT
jgi:excisionase family DNA binding protein